MELYYWKSPDGNFGDDLNCWLWPRLVPEIAGWEVEDWLWVGIGTLLSDSLPAQPQKVIFGTGAGYFQRPPIPDPTWHVYAVRGPLTAKTLGLPGELAVTDSAALLVDVYDQEESGWADGNRIWFVPHHRTAELCGPPWRRVCRDLGIGYLDPRDPVERVLGALDSADLVIAEAMHGAIAADALGRPWIPVRTRGDAILPFKWKDWCRSLDLEYSPAWLPALWDHTEATSSVKPIYWNAKEVAARTRLRWLVKHGQRFLSDRTLFQTRLKTLRSRLDTIRSDLSRGSIHGWQVDEIQR